MPVWCWGWVATQGGPQGPWQCPYPSCWDLSDSCVAVLEPIWMLDGQSHPFLSHISHPLLPNLSRWLHQRHLSLPMAVGGEAGPSPPSMGAIYVFLHHPCRWWESREMRVVPRHLRSAWVPLLCCAGTAPSIPPRLSWSLARCRPSLAVLPQPPLPKSSVTPRAGSSSLFLLSHPSLGRRGWLQGGDPWVPLSVAQSHGF